MRLKALLLSLTLGLFSMAAIAGGGHHHGYSHSPVNQKAANAIATKIIAGFIKQKKLDKSWSSTKVSTSEKKTFNGKKEWVISFINEKVSDAKKRKLYVFLTLSGDYIAANYTGK